MAQTILELQLKGVDEAKASMQGLSEEIVEQRLRQTELKGALKETKKALDAGTISEKDYTKAVAQNNIEMEKSKKIVRENSATLRQNIKVLDAQEGSLDQMRASLNLLQKEFGQLDQSTQEGAMAADAMKQRIQALDTAVKAQEESIGDHRRSVGDYGKALQGLGQYFPILGANISAAAPFLGDFGEKINKFAPLINVMGQNLGFAGGKMNEFVSSASQGPSVLKQTQNTISKMPKGLKALKAGFMAATSGIYAAVKAGLAFLATPIGLALAGVAAATAGAIALFSRAKKKAAEETEESTARLKAAQEEVNKITKEMSDTLADSLTLGDAQLDVLKRSFVDAFAELDALFQQAGEDGGEQYGDAFNEKVDAALGRSQETIKSQYQAERAVLVQLVKDAQKTATNISQAYADAATEADEHGFDMTYAYLVSFNDLYGDYATSQYFDEETIEFLKKHAAGFGNAFDAVEAYGKQLKELDKTYKFDIALSEELAEQTKKTAESYDGTTKSVEDLAEAEKKKQEAERKSEELRKKKREEEKKAEEARQKALDDLLNKEVERNLTEEQLLKKRLDDKLKELGLDKDITKLTDKELQARTALEQKYADDIDDIQETQHLQALQRIKELNDARIKGVTESSSIEVLALKTAHLNKMRQLQEEGKLTEEMRLQAEKDLQLDILNIQRDSAQEQLDLLKSTLALASLGIGKMPQDAAKSMAELSNTIAQLDMDISNLGKNEEGEPETITEKLGVDPDNIEKALFALDTLQESFAIAQQAIGAAESARLKEIDKQVEQGIITQEQAEAKKERISKKAARQQQSISIIQAMINVAQGITKALASLPPPFGQITAATIAAQGAVQIATIKAQKFSKGGMLNGPSHAQGGIPMFSKGGAFYGEAEGGEAVLTKGVMANPALARMASAINVAGGGVPFFANGGVLDPIQSATPTDRAADIIASGLKSRQPVLVVEQLRERENSVDVIESLRTIG